MWRGDSPSPKKQVEQRAAGYRPYLPKNGVELANYNRAQQLYDSPDTIIWCSTTWGNPAAPIVTVPIAGKLTSSSTTFFQPEEAARADYAGDGHGPEPTGGVVSSRSVDGLYHPNPPKYRYGFHARRPVRRLLRDADVLHDGADEVPAAADHGGTDGRRCRARRPVAG